MSQASRPTHMVVSRISSRCTTLHRYLAAVLLVSAVTVSIGTFYTPRSSFLQQLAADGHYEINFDVVESIPDWIASHSGSWEMGSDDRPLETHTVSSDGLLVVNPHAPHPIFQLMRDAETAWEAKCARASKSLAEAVAEYERRYRRRPPLGFDKWWEYVVKHDVQLPDEYDEIFKDIEPFWGIDPTELARTREELEKQERIVTFEKTDAHPQLQVVGATLAEERWGRIRDVIGLLRDVEQDLPPLRFSLSQLDNPLMITDWRVKSMARKAAANGTTITTTHLPALAASGWMKACPPGSPARINPIRSLSPSAVLPPPPSSPKTFIASHREAMDPCLHPWLFSTHGQFLATPNGPPLQKTLMPRFSFCATLLHNDIRSPVPYEWNWESEDEDGAFKEDLPWERKDKNRLDWRGRTTGIYVSREFSWQHGQRQRLVTLANALEGNVSVLSVPENVKESVGDPQNIPLAQVNPAWMDIAFAEKPIHCDEDAGLCDEMKSLWTFQGKQGHDEEGRYKFIFDVDGNGWSGRFKRLITSNALVFKATVYPEWFTSRIAPWVHYVPIQVSYTDLYDAVAFFRVHDELAAKIAKAGREWSRQFWRKEDMTAYLYRLLLEYARVSSLDRASMDYMG